MRRAVMISILIFLFAVWGANDMLHNTKPVVPVSGGTSVQVANPDVSGLPEVYQQMAMRMLSVPAAERPPLAVCFSPETDPEVVRRFTEIMDSYQGSLDYYASGRWSSTASGSTGSQGNPATLTYSFVPDGVALPGGAGEAATPNSLNASMTTKFGSATLWKQKFAQCFARWSALTGVHYVEVTDDGAPFPSSPGQPGARGDLRIASHLIDGQYGILAYNYFPNTGDMILDSGDPWGNSANDYRFMRNTVMHEHGHGLGISHVCPINQSKLMEPYLSLSFDGPQHDDKRAGQRGYGDRYENNDVYTAATNLGALVSGTTTVNDVSTDNAADNDWYRFTLGASAQVSAALNPVGQTYYSDPQGSNGSCPGGSLQLNTLDDQNLDVRLYSGDGTTVLAAGASHPAGVAESLPATTLAAGTYYLRVQNGSTSDVVQLYSLAITLGSGGGGDPTPALTVTSPNGGEAWTIGTAHTVTWTSVNMSESVRVELNRSYPGGVWESLTASTPNTGSYNWSIGGAASASARIRVMSTTRVVGDTSNGSFSITQSGGGTASIRVTTPNGGETAPLNTFYRIYWTSTGLGTTSTVRIQLNRNYPMGTWETLNWGAANSGSYSWPVSGTASTYARIRLISNSNTTVQDVSDGNFRIGSSFSSPGPDGLAMLPDHVVAENYPNPFNPTTTIQYSIPVDGPVRLTVYNLEGREVATLVNGSQTAGTYTSAWDGSTSSSGIYFYRLTVGSQVLTKQMLLLK